MMNNDCESCLLGKVSLKMYTLSMKQSVSGQKGAVFRIEQYIFRVQIILKGNLFYFLEKKTGY